MPVLPGAGPGGESVGEAAIAVLEADADLLQSGLVEFDHLDLDLHDAAAAYGRCVGKQSVLAQGHRGGLPACGTAHSVLPAAGPDFLLGEHQSVRARVGRALHRALYPHLQALWPRPGGARAGAWWCPVPCRPVVPAPRSITISATPGSAMPPLQVTRQGARRSRALQYQVVGAGASLHQQQGQPALAGGRVDCGDVRSWMRSMQVSTRGRSCHPG